MKILFVGDASNYNKSLSIGLRKLGHQVVIASNGSRWMNTMREIDLSRRDGIVGGAILWLKLQKLMLSEFRGFDVVQISNPIFVEQRPVRNKILFKQLKRYNKCLFLTALGDDTAYIRMCLDQNSPIRYNEWMVNGEPTEYYDKFAHIREAWLHDPLKSHCDFIYNEVDGIVTALYEYDVACRRVTPGNNIVYGGIPVDTANIPIVDLPDRPDKVKLFLGMHRDRKMEKGTDRMFTIAQRIASRHPDKCTLDIVENLPYKDYLLRMSTAHVVIDQLYSYTPATNALLAMAMGLNTISGGEEDYYRFIGEDKLRPIINAVPDDEALYKIMEDVILHPENIRPRGLMGREFVEKHNDTMVVAKRFVDFWESKLCQTRCS